MTELRNVEADLSRFRARVLAASLVVLVCFLLLASRLVWLQVVKHEDLQEQAENNRTAIVPIVPNRGLILDRNGIVLATNYSAYTLEIQRARLDRPVEQVIDGHPVTPGEVHRGLVAVFLDDIAIGKDFQFVSRERSGGEATTDQAYGQSKSDHGAAL